MIENIKIHTLCTADHFQHYIPIFCYCLQRVYPENKIYIGVVGELDGITKEACKLLDKCQIRHEENYESEKKIFITENVLTELAQNESTINTARFLYFPSDGGAYMVLDIDLMLFPTHPDLIKWHWDCMTDMKLNYYTHHGPKKRPQRFPDSWFGDKERLAGGFVLLSSDWFEATKVAREKYTKLLEANEIGTYREEDEVVLCNIIKESGLPVVKSATFPSKSRGIHLGDFKETMKHRYTDMDRMAGLIHQHTIDSFWTMKNGEPTYAKIEQQVRQDPVIDQIFINLYEYLEKKGVAIEQA